jgi:hypothetical protein
MGPGLSWGLQRTAQIRRQPAQQFAMIRRAACVAVEEGYVVHPQPRPAAAAAASAPAVAAAPAPPPPAAAAAVATAAPPAAEQAPEGVAEMKNRARRVAEEAFASAMAATGAAGAGREEDEEEGDEPMSGWWVLPLLGCRGCWLLLPGCCG